MAGACDSVNHLLSPYLDNELSGSERKVVDSHLQTCPACQARLIDLKATNAAMQAYLTQRSEGVDFSGFSARVMAQVKKEPLSFGQRIHVAWTELMAYHSAAIYSAFGASAAAALALGVVVARPAAAQNNDLVVHSLKVSDPRYEPVVMHTDDGETVIMLVEHSTTEDDDAAKDAAATPGAPKAGADGKVEAPKVDDVPHGGNL